MKEVFEAIKPYLDKINKKVIIKRSLDSSDASKDIESITNMLADASNYIETRDSKLNRTPSIAFESEVAGENYYFCGAPHGHETTPFLLALLYAGGHPPKINDYTLERVKNISAEIKVEVYSSPNCHNCPTVAEAFGILAFLNPNIECSIIDGTLYRNEIESLGIMAVPTVYINGQKWSVGKIELNEILNRIEEEFGTNSKLHTERPSKTTEMAIIGSGPAGAGAAIYGARKGVEVSLIGDKIGGQLNETVGIENYIGLKSTTGAELTSMMKQHVLDYDVNHIEGVIVEQIKPKAGPEGEHLLELSNGENLYAKVVIIATGADWNKLGVKNENELIGAGISFCPHCDGPMFKNKTVAVVGGGNSGVEAAIDLSGIVGEVKLLVRGDTLTADKVLHKVVESKDNVEIIYDTTVSSFNINKDGGLESINAEGMLDTFEIPVSGCFIQIGLSPKTDFLKNSGIALNQWNEVIVDSEQRTNIEGIYAAGDCTDNTYKQIVIAAGDGSAAALKAYDKLMVN